MQTYNSQNASKAKNGSVSHYATHHDRRAIHPASQPASRGGPRQQQINILMWSVVLWELESTAINGRLLLCGPECR